MSQYLSLPPVQVPFDSGQVPNRNWIEWMSLIQRFARKYRGSGATAERPTNALETGDWYLDTTLGKPVFYTGSTWVYWLSAAADSANSSSSTISVTSADASAVSGNATAGGVGWDTVGNFNTAITAIGTIRTLANELKADVNNLVTDHNTLVTAVNDLKTKLRAAGIIA